MGCSSPRTRIELYALVAAVWLAAGGCGGEAFEEGDGEGEVPSALGEDSRTLLSELDAEQREELCSLMLEAFDENVDNDRFLAVSCTFNAWNISAGVIEDCRQIFDDCMNQLPRPRFSDLVSCDDFAPLDSACVQVRDVRRCYGDYGAVFEASSTALQSGAQSCDEAVANPPPSESEGVSFTEPASCAVVSTSHRSCAQ